MAFLVKQELQQVPSWCHSSCNMQAVLEWPARQLEQIPLVVRQGQAGMLQGLPHIFHSLASTSISLEV